MEAKESESALHCRLLRERDEEMEQRGRKEVVDTVLAIIENPKQVNYRLKEWGLDGTDTTANRE